MCYTFVWVIRMFIIALDNTRMNHNHDYKYMINAINLMIGVKALGVPLCRLPRRRIEVHPVILVAVPR